MHLQQILKSQSFVCVFDIYIRMHIHTYVCIYINAYIYICIRIYIRMYIHTYVHTCIYTYVYTYICMHIHTHIHTWNENTCYTKLLCRALLRICHQRREQSMIHGLFFLLFFFNLFLCYLAEKCSSRQRRESGTWPLLFTFFNFFLLSF